MKNTELFYGYAAQLLAAIYQTIPVPAWLDVFEVAGAKNAMNLHRSLMTMNVTAKGRNCAGTLNSLQSAGFISPKVKNQ